MIDAFIERENCTQIPSAYRRNVMFIALHQKDMSKTCPFPIASEGITLISNSYL